MSNPTASGFQLFSKSPEDVQIELNFAKRLLGFVQGLDVIELHRWVVSGEFNKIFQAVDDGTVPAQFSKFENLNPFDYRDWAKQNRVKD